MSIRSSVPAVTRVEMTISVLSAPVRFGQCWLHGYPMRTDIRLREAGVAALGRDDGDHEYEFLLDGDRRSLDPDPNAPEFSRIGAERGGYGGSGCHGGGFDEVTSDSNGYFIQRFRDPTLAKCPRGFADQRSSRCKCDHLSQQLPGRFRFGAANRLLRRPPQQTEPDRVFVSAGLPEPTQHRVVVAMDDRLSSGAPAPSTLRARCE